MLEPQDGEVKPQVLGWLTTGLPGGPPREPFEDSCEAGYDGGPM